MASILKIALRNLTRYKRRTLLTSLLIVLGVCIVVLFSGLAGSFKSMMIGIVTDSSIGHMQVHRKGYVSSIDTMPLNLNLKAKGYQDVAALLDSTAGVEAYGPRLKFGAVLSNYLESTNVRLTAIDPLREVAVCTALTGRIAQGAPEQGRPMLEQGQVVVPEKVAKSLNLKPGDSVVLVATNRDGSVNGMEFQIAGLIEDVLGPGGKDAYMHIEDGRALLRTPPGEVTEVVIRVASFERLDAMAKELDNALGAFTNQQGKPAFELHTWDKLSPFANIAGMIDLMLLTVKVVMVAIVLISVLNVMLMSVFERVREIGTIAAMGTPPGRIMALFVAEGVLLGVLGTAAGLAAGIVGLLAFKVSGFTFTFGRMDNLLIRPEIDITELLVLAGTVLIASALAALQPAWKAARMAPVDALGHV
jgi:putative ABC transport system permease protein